MPCLDFPYYWRVSSSCLFGGNGLCLYSEFLCVIGITRNWRLWALDEDMEFNCKNIIVVIHNIHQNDFSTTFLSTIACESSKLPFFLCDTLGPQLSYLCIKCIQWHQLIDYSLLPIIVLNVSAWLYQSIAIFHHNLISISSEMRQIIG